VRGRKYCEITSRCIAIKTVHGKGLFTALSLVRERGRQARSAKVRIGREVNCHERIEAQ